MRTTNRANSLASPSLSRLLAAAATVAIALGAPAAASASSVSYSLAGTGTSIPGGCLDCQGPMMDASGTATCSVCVAGKPSSGDFTITLGVQTYPPNPCKVKSVSGALDVTWSDGTTSTAALSGKFRDSKAFALAGTFGSTDPVYPGASATILLNNFPPSPCLAATSPIAGPLDISTP
jgi:hypothetical protein